jgi:hypothetical protein
MYLLVGTFTAGNSTSLGAIASSSSSTYFSLALRAFLAKRSEAAVVGELVGVLGARYLPKRRLVALVGSRRKR